MTRHLTIVLLLFASAACGPEASSGSSDTAFSGYGSEDPDETSGGEAEFDEDSARADAEQEAAAQGYQGSCSDDCSGHDAGFTWAADGHADGGVSASPSFDEGQTAYEEAVEERLEDKRREFEDEGADSDYAM